MGNQAFGQRVAYWRERRRLTQRELAALMEKSVGWVEDVEAGRRPVGGSAAGPADAYPSRR